MYFPVFVPVGVTGNILSFLVNHGLPFTPSIYLFKTKRTQQNKAAKLWTTCLSNGQDQDLLRNEFL